MTSVSASDRVGPVSAGKARIAAMIIGYQPALLLVALAVTVGVLGVTPVAPALPSTAVLGALGTAAVLLLANHIWLMTATELTRLKHDLSATPEEREAAGRTGTAIPPTAQEALDRCHNAHRNTTENAVYFVMLAGLAALITPTPIAMWLWCAGFGLARLGYSFAYLTARTGLRGLFMSLGLICLYGLACTIVLGFWA